MKNAKLKFSRIKFQEYLLLELNQDWLFALTDESLLIFNNEIQMTYIISTREIFYWFNPNSYYKSGGRINYAPHICEPEKRELYLHYFYIAKKWCFYLEIITYAEEWVGVGKDGGMIYINTVWDLRKKKEVKYELLDTLNKKHYGHIRKLDSAACIVVAEYELQMHQQYYSLNKSRF